MQVGIITVGGQQVGVVNFSRSSGDADKFSPDLDGYEPEGRALGGTSDHLNSDHARVQHHHSHGGSAPSPGRHSPPVHTVQADPSSDQPTPRVDHPVRQGSSETDKAIVDASRAHNLDPNFMRSVGSIESGMNPSSNANRKTQYKGLYQVGHDEWRRFGGGGNIYSAHDNAMGTGRMFDANRNAFKSHFGRDPTDTEMYLMHQQGLGFYTRGAMTNIHGNPYPGMRGPQTHESFEAGWGREVARRKAKFEALDPAMHAM